MATNTMTRLRPPIRRKPKLVSTGKLTEDKDFAIGTRRVQRPGQRHIMTETIYSPMKDYRPVPGATNDRAAVNDQAELTRVVSLLRAAQFTDNQDLTFALQLAI